MEPPIDFVFADPAGNCYRCCPRINLAPSMTRELAREQVVRHGSDPDSIWLSYWSIPGQRWTLLRPATDSDILLLRMREMPDEYANLLNIVHDRHS